MNIIKRIIKAVSDDIFYDYNIDKVIERDAVDFHAMTGEHTEVLGQFIDYTAMDAEQLKECLISGYLSMVFKHGQVSLK